MIPWKPCEAHFGCAGPPYEDNRNSLMGSTFTYDSFFSKIG